jgi:hypothetical protein
MPLPWSAVEVPFRGVVEQVVDRATEAGRVRPHHEWLERAVEARLRGATPRLLDAGLHELVEPQGLVHARGLRPAGELDDVAHERGQLVELELEVA